MKIIALKVTYNNELCGYLAQATNSAGKQTYMYKYVSEYTQRKYSRAISFNLPVQDEPFYSEQLFSFFENLVSEGWLRRQQAKFLNINENDSFSLLSHNGADLIGAVAVLQDEQLALLLEPYFKNPNFSYHSLPR